MWLSGLSSSVPHELVLITDAPVTFFHSPHLRLQLAVVMLPVSADSHTSSYTALKNSFCCHQTRKLPLLMTPKTTTSDSREQREYQWHNTTSHCQNCWDPSVHCYLPTIHSTHQNSVDGDQKTPTLCFLPGLCVSAWGRAWGQSEGKTQGWPWDCSVHAIFLFPGTCHQPFSRLLNLRQNEARSSCLVTSGRNTVKWS